MKNDLSYYDLSNKREEEIFSLYKTNIDGLSKIETEDRLKEFGENIVSELTIKKIKKLIEEGHDIPIIIEGIRSLQEVDMFKESFDNFIILSVFANENLRFERLKKRMREDDSKDYNVFQKRDRTELGFGLGNVISLSDKIIINESDLDSYKEKIRETLEEINL